MECKVCSNLILQRMEVLAISIACCCCGVLKLIGKCSSWHCRVLTFMFVNQLRNAYKCQPASKYSIQQHAMLIHIALLCLQDDNCVCCHIWFVWCFPLHILMFQYMYTLNHFVYLSGLGDPQSLFRFSALMSAWSFRSIVVQTSWCNRQWQIWHLLNYNHRERQLHFRLWQNVSLAALNNGHCADLWKSIQLWCCVSDSIHSYIHIHIHSSNHALIHSTHVFL